jgi:hypothetical protein
MAKERLSKLQKWILKECLERGYLRGNEAREYFGKRYPGSKRHPKTFPKRDFNLAKVEEARERIFGKDHKDDAIIETIIEKAPIGYCFPIYDSNFKRVGQEYEREVYTISIKPELIITRSEEAVISRSYKNLLNKGFLKRNGKYGKYRLTEKGLVKANKFVTRDTNVSFKDYTNTLLAQKIQSKEQLLGLSEGLLPMAAVSGRMNKEELDKRLQAIELKKKQLARLKARLKANTLEQNSQGCP